MSNSDMGQRKLETCADHLRCVDDFDVVSFDVFETLIRRRNVFRPLDLFFQIGERVSSVTRLGDEEFADLRIKAERAARARLDGHKKQEVTLDEIYLEFNCQMMAAGRQWLSQEDLKTVADVEIAIELETLEPNPTVKAFYEKVRELDKTIIVMSDFYIAGDFVQKALSQCGYSDYDLLLVSCNEQKTKHHGDLYKLAVERLRVPAERIVHVGDNLRSDGARALAAGLGVLRCRNPVAELTARHAMDWQKATPRSTSLMRLRQAETLYGWGFDRRDPSAAPLPDRVGRECLGPLLLGLVGWLYDEASAANFTDYYFCARDGLIMKAAFDAYQKRFGPRLRTHYLEVSRQAIYRGVMAFDADEGARSFIQNWSHLSPAQALSRFGLDADDFRREILDAGFRAPEETVSIGDQVGLRRMEALAGALRSSLRLEGKRHLELLYGYMTQAELTKVERPCVVDIGWHASMQRGLQKVLNYQGQGVKVAGRYLGLFLTVQDPMASGFLFSRDGAELCEKLRLSPSLVELLHTAGHGSVSGYAWQGDRIVVNHEDRFEEASQYEALIGPIQQSALTFVDEIIAEAPAHEPIAPEDAFAGLGRLLSQPEADEYASLGKLKIAANFGGESTLTGLATSDDYRLWRPSAFSHG